MSRTVHFNIKQGSKEWDAIRAGKWTASKAGVIMGGLETNGLKSLVKDIAWERVYGPHGEDGFKSKAMERGHEVEPEAIDWYAFEKGLPITHAGFVEHASIPHVGWSPDGLPPNAGVEAKSPLHKAWMEVKRTGKIPAEYRWQCRWAIWTGELEWLDFVAYHPTAGGLIIPAELKPEEAEQMTERVELLEQRVATWIGILTDKKESA